jgi:transposase
MCHYKYYDIMRKSKDNRTLRYQMVTYAEKHGIKPAMRHFKASRNTVRKWIRRWQELGYAGLNEISRKPHNSPGATPEEEREKLVKLKKKYKRMGADQIKKKEDLTRSARTIRKVWREKGESSRKRPKKHETKQNLREVKKQYALFRQAMEDTKELDDIPEYYMQMKTKNLFTIQYTFRDVTSGLMFLGFADQKSLIYATLFARYINHHLLKYGVDLSKTIRQTDNGSEYIGSWQAKSDSIYTKEIESIPGQRHSTIFPGAHRMQADVETVHNLIEMEFYEIEKFHSRQNFMDKAYSYQLYFNLERTNSYKEDKTPWQLAKEKIPDLDVSVAMIPPVDLCKLLKNNLFLLTGGHDVYSVPFVKNL